MTEFDLPFEASESWDEEMVVGDMEPHEPHAGDGPNPAYDAFYRLGALPPDEQFAILDEAQMRAEERPAEEWESFRQKFGFSASLAHKELAIISVVRDLDQIEEPAA